MRPEPSRQARSSPPSKPSQRDRAQTTFSHVLTWAAVIMALLSLPLLINFVGRVQDEQRMAVAAQQSTADVQRAEVRNAQLHDALVYAQSDAFTERYAREQMHYTKAGEILVLPPAGTDLTALRHPWWQDFVTDDTGESGESGDNGATGTTGMAAPASVSATAPSATALSAPVPVSGTSAEADNGR